MKDLFVESYVDHLMLIEQVAGHQAPYRMMPPPSFSCHDRTAWRMVANQIGEFVGLKDRDFRLTGMNDVSMGVRGVPGEPWRTETPESVVPTPLDINPEARTPEAVGACICREICRVWLCIHEIRASSERESAVLADVAAVFLGLGKIMLNGCLAAPGKLDGLDRDQLAFVYRLVCAMRKIDGAEIMPGLTEDASRAVRACDENLGRHYGPGFHRSESITDSLASFDDLVLKVQRRMAELDKHAIYMRKSFDETIDDFLVSGHGMIDSLRRNALIMPGGREPTPVLRFLRGVKISRLTCRMRAVSDQAEALLGHAREVCRVHCRSDGLFPPPTAAMFTIVTCPKDGQKLRLPENAGNITVKCPGCKYEFAYNTRPPAYREERGAGGGRERRRGRGSSARTEPADPDRDRPEGPEGAPAAPGGWLKALWFLGRKRGE